MHSRVVRTRRQEPAARIGSILTMRMNEPSPGIFSENETTPNIFETETTGKLHS